MTGSGGRANERERALTEPEPSENEVINQGRGGCADLYHTDRLRECPAEAAS